MQKQIRIFLILSLVALFAGIISSNFYDPTVSPLILQVDKIGQGFILNGGFVMGLATIIFFLLEIIFFIYSFIALWLGHRSGKWALIIYLLMGSLDYYFFKIVAFSWLTMGMMDLYTILSGIILGIAFFATPNKK